MQEIHYLKKEIYDLVKTDDLVFEFLQDGVLDGIWYWDLEKVQNEWMSHKFWKLFGYDPNEKAHLSEEWQDIINQDDLKLATINFQKHLENPDYPYDQIVRYTHKDGSIVWVRCRGVAIYGLDGKPKRMLGAHLDITEIMNKQQSLVQKEMEIKKLKKELLIVQHKLTKQSSQLDHIEGEMSDINPYEDDGKFLIYDFFKQRAEQLFKIAQRTDATINVIGLYIKNHDYIRTNYSQHELLSKKIIISEILHQEFQDSLITRFNEYFIIIIDIGYEPQEIEDKVAQSHTKINSHNWSIITPQIKILEMHKKYEDDCLNKFIVEITQQLSQ